MFRFVSEHGIFNVPREKEEIVFRRQKEPNKIKYSKPDKYNFLGIKKKDKEKEGKVKVEKLTQNTKDLEADETKDGLIEEKKDIGNLKEEDNKEELINNLTENIEKIDKLYSHKDIKGKLKNLNDEKNKI